MTNLAVPADHESETNRIAVYNSVVR